MPILRRDSQKQSTVLHIFSEHVCLECRPWSNSRLLFLGMYTFWFTTSTSPFDVFSTPISLHTSARSFPGCLTGRSLMLFPAFIALIISIVVVHLAFASATFHRDVS